jgi:flagellar basal-body rod modification protein FlgD
MTTTTSSTAAPTATNNAASTSTSKTMANEADKFLKLLVTQMQNQDPLNPLDNAQVTSQMAQINTVTGIDKLNTTMTSMNSSFTQMQMLQGAGLVGHGVLLEGNQLNVDSERKAVAGYELAAGASNVRIDVTNAAGVVIDSFNETGKGAGRQSFSWTAPENVATEGLTFKVTATSGTKAITATPLMGDYVSAVSNTDGALTLELAFKGSTPYSKVKALS